MQFKKQQLEPDMEQLTGSKFEKKYNNIIREGNGDPLQYSCLENPTDGGAWRAAVHGVTKSWT